MVLIALGLVIGSSLAVIVIMGVVVFHYFHNMPDED